MALTIQVGQTGTLVFTPHTVGIDPARITKTTWKAGKGTAVDFVLPDQVTGVAPGVETEFHCEVTLAPIEEGATADKQTWLFDITCIEPGPTPIPPVVPVVIDNLITPPPAP
jgi:hypothetical protein